uniref:Cytochrome b561 and DOMON domain-containing protein n=1 Tax=Kalanchoe fedtschenkoi TaxID=63787 RepID=A0A7N0VC30_KALFE
MKTAALLPLLLLSCLALASVSAQTCGTYKFSNNAIFTSCNDLPVLNSYLHWTYDDSTRKANIAYRHTGVSTSQWVAWAINPSASNMIGCQALVAYHNSTGAVTAYTSPITSYRTTLSQGDLSFPVTGLTASYSASTSEMIIFATIELPSATTTVNQVWQVGPMTGDTPQIHSTSGDNVKSMSTIDFLSGQSTGGSGSTGLGSRIRKRNTHGILNAVSWGILMPAGAMFARYLKVSKAADPAWFYLHITCQTSAYIVGVAGWATGLKLGSDSVGVEHGLHRSIGIALFCLGTLQVFALLLRPKKDHKIRIYWNVYHHATGYAVIALSIANVYEGFEILGQDGWKRVYTGIIIALGAVAVVLEIFTWIVVLKRNKSEVSDKHQHGSSNGVNGNGGGYSAARV